MEKSIGRDNFRTVADVIKQYFCNICPTEPGVRMDWRCACNSELLEMHPGYVDFITSHDMLVLHCFHISLNMQFVAEYTLPNGTVLRDFIVTDNGILSDNDMKQPGTKLFMVPGFSKHSDLYKVAFPGEWAEHNHLNANYSGLRALVFSFVTIINPSQDRDIQRGKMSVDMDPRKLSKWCTAFLDCWQSFVNSNPRAQIKALYRTNDGVFYGSPTDHATSHLLYGYAGLPLLLNHYLGRISHYVKQLIALSKQSKKDKKAVVPPGNYFKLIAITITHLLDCDLARKYMEGKFGRTGKFLMLNSDPENSFNILLGHIILTIWEMIDSFILAGVPYDPAFPLSSSTDWCLLEFVPKKVSPSGTFLSDFPYYSSILDHYVCFNKLCTAFKSIF